MTEMAVVAVPTVTETVAVIAAQRVAVVVITAVGAKVEIGAAAGIAAAPRQIPPAADHRTGWTIDRGMSKPMRTVIGAYCRRQACLLRTTALHPE